MTQERHDRTELGERRVEHGAQEQREHEQHKKDRRVPHDGADSHNGDADEGRRRLLAVLVGERLHEHVRDCEEDSHDEREDDLGEDDRPPFRARDVAGKPF